MRTLTSKSILDERMPRVDALTGLRWYAALFVFGYHMLVFAPLPGVAAVFLSEGFFGVTFFFVLSGFVLTWSASSTVSRSTFYWRRFARIYPTHFVSLLIAIPVFYSFNPDPSHTWVKPVSLGVLSLSFVLLQAWSPAPSVLFSGNPAAWTLTCEAFFYALHPFISRPLNRMRVRGSLLFVIGIFFAAFCYRAGVAGFPASWLPIIPLPIVRLSEFAVGMGLAWAFRCGWRPRIPVPIAFGTLLSIIICIVILTHYFPASIITRLFATFSNELVTVGCALTIAAIAKRSRDGKRSFFASRVHVRLGEWSFAFYLTHATVIYIALSTIGIRATGWSNLLWFAALLMVAGVAAGFLHHCVEKPLERRLRAWKDSRAAAPV